MPALEMWGGIECSLNRVRDLFHSQIERSGHAGRPGDLDAVAVLGIRTLRYPVLWEATAPDLDAAIDWRWVAARLEHLRALAIRPIVGLVHHGSGPPHTDLLAACFAPKLAAFAAAVARRFPWVSDYTPVNEPLTTARFSALYGFWYPHRRDDAAFVRALLNQCRGIVLAMEAVRAVNPLARLVQTEDLGRVYATRAVRAQADFENDRRWLGWDLLIGRVGRDHPLYSFLVGAGAAPAELAWFAERACRIDLVGINHYVTSERFLHHDCGRFPVSTHGGNGRQRYADVEAVRVLPRPSTGLAALLREAWQRYRLPLAVTEVHLGCTREEQMRWLFEAWTAAGTARALGADVRAVTAWALFGGFDWPSLLTSFRGQYEPGAFDVRGGRPRPTALAHLIGTLARGGTPPADAVCRQPGWWRRPVRLLPGVRVRRAAEPPPPSGARPLMITGGAGTLGHAFARVCGRRGLHHQVLPRVRLDICAAAAVREALAELRPWAVVNAAGYVRVDDAEGDAEACRAVNTRGAAVLAAACAESGVRLLTFSTDLVFDGGKATPYVEDDTTAPLSLYGQSKAAAEAEVLACYPDALVVRSSAFFGPWDAHNFVRVTLARLARGEETAVADDVTVSPTYVPDLADAALDLLLDGESGRWHLANAGALTWADFARAAAARAGVAPGSLRPVPGQTLGWRAARPRYSVLGSARGGVLPALEDALARFVHEARLAS
jgi:dTDP-4-dehydrorhamnose reductase